MTVQAATRHSGESESVFEKYPNYIRSGNTGCCMSFIKISN